MDILTKVQHTVDAQFGHGAHGALPPDVMVRRSRRTGRVRNILDGQKRLLGTLKPDGGIAITVLFARMLQRDSGEFESYCVQVTPDAAPFIEQGRSVFCKHVVKCGINVRAGSDTPILYDGKVIAIGRALLSCEIISDMKSGVAIKVRHGLKGRDEYK